MVMYKHGMGIGPPIYTSGRLDQTLLVDNLHISTRYSCTRRYTDSHITRFIESFLRFSLFFIIHLQKSLFAITIGDPSERTLGIITFLENCCSTAVYTC